MEIASSYLYWFDKTNYTSKRSVAYLNWPTSEIPLRDSLPKRLRIVNKFVGVLCCLDLLLAKLNDILSSSSDILYRPTL